MVRTNLHKLSSSQRELQRRCGEAPCKSGIELGGGVGGAVSQSVITIREDLRVSANCAEEAICTVFDILSCCEMTVEIYVWWCRDLDFSSRVRGCACRDEARLHNPSSPFTTCFQKYYYSLKICAIASLRSYCSLFSLLSSCRSTCPCSRLCKYTSLSNQGVLEYYVARLCTSLAVSKLSGTRTN
jgi:hypothetical protein